MTKEPTPTSFNYLEDIDAVIPVKDLRGVDYELREVSAADGKRFKNQAAQSVIMTDSGAKKIKNPANLQYLILTMSLHNLESGAPVSKEFLDTLPNRIVEELSLAAMQISGLDNTPDKDEDEDEDDAVKNF